MKYSIGDKVRVKSIDWYNQMLSIPNKVVWQNNLSEEFVGIWCGSQIFYKDMCVYCDRIMTIRGIVEDSYYIMEEDNCGYKFTDGMLEGKVEEELNKEIERFQNLYDDIMEKNNTLPVADPLYVKDERVELNDGRSGIVDKSWWDDDEKCYMYIVSIGRGDCDVVKESELKMSGDNAKFYIGDRITDGKNHLIITKVLSDRYIVVDSLDEMGVLYFSSQDNWRYDTGWMYDGNLVAERFSDDKEVPKFRKDDRVETHDGLFGYIEDIEYDDVRNCYQYYVSFIVDGGYYYEEQLKFHERKVVDSKLPKFKVGDMICRVGGLSNGCLVMSVSDEYYGLQMGEGNVGVLPVADQDEWVLLSAGNKIKEDEVEVEKDDIVWNLGGGRFQVVLPKGYRFVDVGGNPIAVDKIVLEKEGVCYPKTYEKCCEILDCSYNVQFDRCETSYESKLHDKLLILRELLICRDAYWKIAGEEMGLGKPWEPDFESDIYYIYYDTHKRKFSKEYCAYGININLFLVFPTEDMRDAFYENFKDLIEECKELL